MNGVSKILITEDVALVSFSKLPASLKEICEIFKTFAQGKINIDMISQSAPHKNSVSLAFTVPGQQLMQALSMINQLRATNPSLKPMVSSSNYKIQLFGEEMRHMHGVAAAVMDCVLKENAELNLITTSEIDISLLVTSAHLEQVVQSLQEVFQVTATVVETH